MATTKIWGSTAAASALALIPLLVGAPDGEARGTAVTCGATLTASVTLAADLSCPGSGVALTVGRDGVVVNLNGHALLGNGTGGTDGISVDGRKGITIENGTVDDFATDVSVQNNAGVRITNARIAHATVVGVLAEDGSDLTATNDLVFSNATGIETALGGSVHLSGDAVESNTQDGIVISQAETATISGDKVLSNGADGIRVTGPATIGGNVANGNGANGISADSTATEVKAPLTLTRNRAAFNAQLGILVTPGGANDGGGNVVQANGTAAQCRNVVCVEVSG